MRLGQTSIGARLGARHIRASSFPPHHRPQQQKHQLYTHFHHKTLRHTSAATRLKMPSYVVTVKDDATPEQLQAAKQHAKDQGGTIGHEFTLIKGFSVSFPEGSVHSLDKNEHVKAVELDQEMRTQ